MWWLIGIGGAIAVLGGILARRGSTMSGHDLADVRKGESGAMQQHNKAGF